MTSTPIASAVTWWRRVTWPTYARRRCTRSIQDRHVSRAGEAGYSLVEILVVLAIIGLIMSFVGPRVVSYLSDSKVKAARIQIEGFSAALDLYYLDNGRYPSSSEGLVALVRKPDAAPSWNGPYLKGSSVPNDPWGRPYVYASPGQNGPFDVQSLGPDGRNDVTGSVVTTANSPR